MRRDIDFVGKRVVFITISLIFIALSLIFIFTKGFDLGVDFTGGTEMIIRVKSQDVTEADLRNLLDKIGFTHARVTRSGLNVSKKEGKDFIVTVRHMFFAKTPDEIVNEIYNKEVKPYQVFSAVLGRDAKDLANRINGLMNSFDKIIEDMKKGADLTADLKPFFGDKASEVAKAVNSLITPDERKADLAGAVDRKREMIEKFLLKKLIEKPVEEYGKTKVVTKILSAIEKNLGKKAMVISFTEISGSAAQEIRSGTYTAVLVAIIAILLYITLRFNFIFGIGAIVALIHDVTITLGFYSFFGYEMNVPAVAAILTLIGYSLNDTIVVYDRIRENFRRYRKMDVERLVNRSINEVIVRSINTSLTTFFVVLILLIFAGKTIKSFAFGMTVGTVVGTYSSLYIAAPIVIKWVKKF